MPINNGGLVNVSRGSATCQTHTQSVSEGHCGLFSLGVRTVTSFCQLHQQGCSWADVQFPDEIFSLGLQYMWNTNIRFLGWLLLYNVQIIVQVKVVTIKKKHFCHWRLYQNSFLYRIFFSHRVTTGFFVGFKLLPPGSCVRFPSVKVNRFRHSVPSAIALLNSNLERLYLDWFFFFRLYHCISRMCF